MAVAPTDELPHRHPGGAPSIDEWVFTAWSDDAALGLISGHRLVAGTAWYWSALARSGEPLLHLSEWGVTVRADPFVVKAHEMWAEHHCVSPLEQWSLGNEAYFVALDDPAAALDRAYGVPTPTAMDLEWYAVTGPHEIADGFIQEGVVHGRVDVMGIPPIELAEVPARRWRRWSRSNFLSPVEPGGVVAHTGLRAPFAFPDGTLSDWVVTPQGWRSRDRRSPARR
jgi:hypothetical protein